MFRRGACTGWLRAAALLLLAHPGFAAPVSWEPAQVTTGAAQLLTGAVAFARNGGSGAVTVGGRLFLSHNLGSGFVDNLYTSGGPGPMQSTGDADFDALVRSFTYGGGTGATVVVTGLTTGAAYRVQVFFNDQRSNSANRVMRFGDGLGGFVDVPGSAVAGPQTNDYGMFAVGAFTADVPSQVVTLAATNFANCHLNALLVARVTNPPPLASSTGRNVVVLLLDDGQPDLVGALGNPDIETPNLDALCRAGTIFRQAHIMGGWSGAVCLPSRTMLMTGRSLWRIPGRAQNPVVTNQADLTLPAVFNAAGYDTLRSGKQGNTYLEANVRFGQYAYHDNRDAIASSRFVDDALAFLSSRAANSITSPFLVYLGFDHPHDPRRAPQLQYDRYHAAVPGPDTNTALNLYPPRPANWLPRHPFDNGHLDVRDETSVDGVGTNRDERTVRNEIAKNFAAMDYLDTQVGRLVSNLVASGNFTNTLFVLASDNGLAIGRHGLMGKQSLYEHSIRVPLCLTGPGIPAATNDALVYLHDLLPTLCELTGVPAPASVESRSLVPLLTGATNRVYEAQLYAYLAVQRAVREGDWKLIHYPAIHRTQLFQLADDPLETNDLSNQPEQAGRIAGLAARLEELQAAYGDNQLSNALGRIGANVARGRAAGQLSDFSAAYRATNACDGAGSTLSSFSHTAPGDSNAWWLVDLGEDVDVEEVQLQNRTDCCAGRLRDITVEVLDVGSNVVWVSPLLNPSNLLGGGESDYINGPAVLGTGRLDPPPVGRLVRVWRTPGPGVSAGDRTVLAMAEAQVFAAPYDADGDGLSDRWERRHFGALTNAQAGMDHDGDGFSEAEEFRAGTQPTNAASFLRTALLPSTDAGVRVRWPSESNIVYAVERSTNELAGWDLLTNVVIATPPTNEIADPAPPPRASYRAVIPF